MTETAISAKPVTQASPEEYDGSTPLKNDRYEMFVAGVLSGKKHNQSILDAGFTPAHANARYMARNILARPNVAARLAFLRKTREDEMICSLMERKRILSQIARGKLVDYQDEKCNITINKESPNPHAIQSLEEEERSQGEEEDAAIVVTRKFKLRDPVAAITELNKLEGSYAAVPVGAESTTLAELFKLAAENRDTLPATRKQTYGASRLIPRRRKQQE